MRGKVLRLVMMTSAFRITPAYAGKSRRCTGLRQCTGDHPRLCGEKWEIVKTMVGDTGITPAYAGKRKLMV